MLINDGGMYWDKSECVLEHVHIAIPCGHGSLYYYHAPFISISLQWDISFLRPVNKKSILRSS